MTEQVSDKILRRVQALLAQADHPNTDPIEATTFREKAEALMWQYRIDAAMAKPAEGAPSVLPQWTTLFVCNTDTEFRTYYQTLFYYVAQHCDIRYVLQASEDWQTYVAKVVGYEADLKVCEALYTSCLMAFGSKVEPKYDPSLSDQVNAYNMRSAGMEGRRIAQAIYGRDDKSLRPKVRAMFKKEAEARGEDPTPLLGRGSNMKEWRVNYASAFVDTIRTRLAQMREARGQVSGALVMVSQRERVDETFYEAYPSKRPQPASTKRLPSLQDQRRDCPKCQKAKSGYCREHQWMKPKAGRSGGTRYNSAAQARGRDAALSADIGRTPGNTVGGMKEIG